MNRNGEKNRVLIRRTFAVIFFNLLAFSVIFARLYYLQVREADKYKMMSDENRISTRFLVPPRGLIYDRNGEIIAKNEQDFQALLVAEQSPNIEKTLQTFKQIIPLSAEEENKILKNIKKTIHCIWFRGSKSVSRG